MVPRQSNKQVYYNPIEREHTHTPVPCASVSPCAHPHSSQYVAMTVMHVHMHTPRHPIPTPPTYPNHHKYYIVQGEADILKTLLK